MIGIEVDTVNCDVGINLIEANQAEAVVLPVSTFVAIVKPFTVAVAILYGFFVQQNVLAQAGLQVDISPACLTLYDQFGTSVNASWHGEWFHISDTNSVAKRNVNALLDKTNNVRIIKPCHQDMPAPRGIRGLELQWNFLFNKKR